MTENTTINNAQELSKKEKKAAYDRAYRNANKEKRAAQNAAWYHATKSTRQSWGSLNKERNAVVQKAYREKNREKILERERALRQIKKEKKTVSKKIKPASKEKKTLSKELKPADKEKKLAYHREWRKSNPGKTYRTKQERYKKDPTKKIKDLFRSAVYKAFYRIKQNKPTNTQTLLGCTWDEARAHFESLFTQGMSWSNHGEWHIDHIRPVASFSLDELRIMNHISNLQPLWAKDNLSKGDRH